MSFNLVKIVVDYLQANSGQKFTAREIALWILKTYPDECSDKQKRSTATVKLLDNDAALLQQFVAEIGAQRPRMQKRYPEVKITEGRPRKYYFTQSTDAVEVDYVEAQEALPDSGGNRAALKEHDLYSILSQFLWSEFEVYSKSIDEKRSKNSAGAGGNKWLYPDLVGVEDLSSGWHREIKECVQHYGDNKTKLWSFEVKILINRSNVREVFFQTVSNSSWANFGYLVATEISEDAFWLAWYWRYSSVS